MKKQMQKMVLIERRYLGRRTFEVKKLVNVFQYEIGQDVTVAEAEAWLRGHDNRTVEIVEK